MSDVFRAQIIAEEKRREAMESKIQSLLMMVQQLETSYSRLGVVLEQKEKRICELTQSVNLLTQALNAQAH